MIHHHTEYDADARRALFFVVAVLLVLWFVLTMGGC